MPRVAISIRRKHMRTSSRRAFIGSISAAAVIGPTAKAGDETPADLVKASIIAQVASEECWAFFRSFYGDKDNVDIQGFLSHFVKSGQTTYEDAVLGFGLTGYNAIAPTFAGFFNSIATTLGKGSFSKVFRVVGDMRYGAVAEYVDLKNTFFSTNGITIQAVFDIDNGLVARDTDYWDSRELGMSDIVGPANTSGVAIPLGAVHVGGVPRTAASPVPPGPVQLAVGVTGRPSVSAEMLSFVQAFHDTLRQGTPHEISGFFTEDALYVNPVIHQGGVGYGNFDRGIQIRGRTLIAKFFESALQNLPDCRNSTLIHVVGGAPGGGFEWKAGGIYSKTGLDRTGLVGCTALDLFGNRIQRMSVKFDTFQMSAQSYDNIRRALFQSGVVDQ
jgi:hypothetical protein